MADQPRLRDAGIIMIVAAVLGAVLGLLIVVPAVDQLPESKETVVWSALLLVCAIMVFGLGLRNLRRAKEHGSDAF